MVTIYTPDEFAEEMTRIAKKLDDEEWIGLNTEECHIEADAMMCEILTALGYGKGVDIFNSMPKWYA